MEAHRRRTSFSTPALIFLAITVALTVPSAAPQRRGEGQKPSGEKDKFARPGRSSQSRYYSPRLRRAAACADLTSAATAAATPTATSFDAAATTSTTPATATSSSVKRSQPRRKVYKVIKLSGKALHRNVSDDVLVQAAGTYANVPKTWWPLRILGRHRDVGEDVHHVLVVIPLVEGQDPPLPQEITIDGHKCLARVLHQSNRTRIIVNGVCTSPRMAPPSSMSPAAYSSTFVLRSLQDSWKIVMRNLRQNVRPEHIEAYFDGCGECVLINHAQRKTKDNVTSETYIVGFDRKESVDRALKRKGMLRHRSVYLYRWIEEQNDCQLDANTRIKAQVEYYFSERNLVKDPHLNRLILDGDEGWVSLDELMAWNKMKALTSDNKHSKKSMVVKALLNSSTVELDDRRMHIRRRGTGNRYGIIVYNMYYGSNLTDFITNIKRISGVVDAHVPVSMGSRGDVHEPMFIGNRGRFQGKVVILADSRKSAEKISEHFADLFHNNRKLRAYVIRVFHNTTAVSVDDDIRTFLIEASPGRVWGKRVWGNAHESELSPSLPAAAAGGATGEAAAAAAGGGAAAASSWFGYYSSYFCAWLVYLQEVLRECLRRWRDALPSIPPSILPYPRGWMLEKAVALFWGGGDRRDGGDGGAVKTHNSSAPVDVEGSPTIGAHKISCSNRSPAADSRHSQQMTPIDVANNAKRGSGRTKGWFAQLWD